MREKSHVEMLTSQVVLYFMSDKNSGKKNAYAVISSIKYKVSFEGYELYIVC